MNEAQITRAAEILSVLHNARDQVKYVAETFGSLAITVDDTHLSVKWIQEPGFSTPMHCWCVVCIVRGEETMRSQYEARLVEALESFGSRLSTRRARLTRTIVAAPVEVCVANTNQTEDAADSYACDDIVAGPVYE